MKKSMKSPTKGEVSFHFVREPRVSGELIGFGACTNPAKVFPKKQLAECKRSVEVEKRRIRIQVRSAFIYRSIFIVIELWSSPKFELNLNLFMLSVSAGGK